jgi:hypothetical protein
MRIQRRALLSLALLFPSVALAKDKKVVMPAYVLTAHTVAVVIDPDAGISLSDPRANQTAREDVEKALMKWGRLEPVLSQAGADLIIVVRKGHSRLAEPTIGDPRINNRGGVAQPTDDGGRIGAQHGPPPPLNQGGMGPDNTGPHPQVEVGPQEDSFVVYEGDVATPLDGPPGWRYMRKDALHSPDVPAVEEFRKAIVAAEKQAKP